MLHYVSGNLADKDFELMEEPLEADGEAVSTLLRQYYAARGARGRGSSCCRDCMADEDLSALSELFSGEAGRKVRVEVPQRGDRRQLLDTAMTNAREEVERGCHGGARSRSRPWSGCRRRWACPRCRSV